MSDAVTPIRPAATVLLLRDEPAFEVLMVRRHHQIDFVPGAMVFPGGKTHAGDHHPRWAERCIGWAGTPETERPLRIAAIREAYEEAGLLIARRGDGEPFPGDERAQEARAAVAKDERSFLDVVELLDLRLDLEALTLFARWITPDIGPKRFDTWFYVARAASDQLAVCDGWETVEAEWISPKQALQLAAAGEREVIFPTRMNLKLLAEAGGVEDAIVRAAARPVVVVEPWLERRADGPVLVIPTDAGYGEVIEPLSALGL
ncbi:MAG: NUDIX domain-containing protein [Caulobacteraceae bacterium]|nr:NUDIX domain-containing protein [Caulobacteraceae bacterium]